MRTDVFGLAPRQHDMFGVAQETFDEPMTVEEIRAELLATLDLLRTSEAMPWPVRTMLRIETMFPDIAARLPPGEAETLVERFLSEMSRLRTKAA